MFLNHRARRIILAVAGLISVAGTVPLLAALAQPGPSTSNQVDEFFVHGTLVKPERLISVVGFQQGGQGWYLDPGASGKLVYRVPGYSGTTTAVNLWVDAPEGVSNSVSVVAPGLPEVRVATDLTSSGDRLDIPPQYATASSLDLQIEGHNGSAVQKTVIEKITTYSVTGTDPRPPPLYSFLAFGSVVALVAYALLRSRPNAIPISVGIGAVSSIAAAARIAALFTLHLATDPDAVAFRIYGDRFQWWPLFDNGIFSGNFHEREPLFPLVLHAYFQVLGSSDFHERVVSSTLSIAVVILSMVAARRRLQTWWAPVLVGLAIAISGPLIQESDRGLRLELETLLFLGLYLALDRGPARRPLLDAALIGVLGAAMALTRTYFIPVFLVAVAVSFFFRYRSLPKVVGLVAVATIVMGGAEAADRFGLYEHQGNAFFDTAGYVRWSANEELYRFHRPLDHIELFPTLSEYQTQGNYAGPSISSYQYLFVIHSPVELARDTLAGSRLIFDTMDSFIFDVRAAVDIHAFPTSLATIAKSAATRFDMLLSWAVLLGLLAMCLGAIRDPRLLIIPTIVVAWLGMTAFLFDHSVLERYRHTWQTYPLALIAGAWLVERSVLYIWSRARVRYIINSDVALFTAALVLTLATYVGPQSARDGAVALVALSVAALTYRRPAWGVGAAVLSVAAGGGMVGAVAALVSAGAVLVKLRPQVRRLRPLLVLIPLAVAIVIAGGAFSISGLEAVGILAGLVTAVAVAGQDRSARYELIWLLAAMGPLAAIVALIHPSAPGVVELAPTGAVAAAWLYLRGHRSALTLGLLNFALVLFVEPFAAWIGVAVVVAWMALRAGRVPRPWRLVAAGALAATLAILTAGASLSAATPSPSAPWSTRLDSPTSSVRQEIVADRAGDTSLWIYARRSTTLADFPFSVMVNGTPITTDLNSSLPTDYMTWNRIALGRSPRAGERLQVDIVAGGEPNPTDRFVEIGGVYAVVDGISSRGVNGTYLIVLGDDSLPLAPGGLPEPMVRDRLQPPMGGSMPGELGAPVDARQQAAIVDLWYQALLIGLHHPLGIGTGNLGASLQDSGAGFGPGLTARSEPLQALAEWGWLGLAGLLLLLVLAGWLARRSEDRFPMALLGLAAITMLGESLLSDAAGAASVWLAVGLCVSAMVSHAAAPSIWPASNGETPPKTSPPEAIHAG